MEEKSENAKAEQGELELSEEGEREEQKIDLDAMTKPSLDWVDDDALLLIVDRIPLRERVRLETINKRWQQLCYRSWQRVKSLQMRWFSNDQLELSPEAAEGVLKRCGRGVLSVSFEVGFKKTQFESELKYKLRAW